MNGRPVVSPSRNCFGPPVPSKVGRHKLTRLACQWPTQKREALPPPTHVCAGRARRMGSDVSVGPLWSPLGSGLWSVGGRQPSILDRPRRPHAAAAVHSTSPTGVLCSRWLPGRLGVRPTPNRPASCSLSRSFDSPLVSTCYARRTTGLNDKLHVCSKV